jgi:hypothetical protein
MKNIELREGDRVRVKLYGDDRAFTGTVLDRPRKLWVKLDDYEVPEFIADEGCIETIELLQL